VLRNSGTSGTSAAAGNSTSRFVSYIKKTWDNHRIPEFNSNNEQSSASMQRMADIMAKENAQLWINHDKVQRDGQKLSPDFYE
jgi:N-acyl homoserine lactone hydrolase